MRLVCPHCGKAHIVREEALGTAGRNVRCSACKSQWFANAQGTYVRKSASEAKPGARSTQSVVDQAQKAAQPRRGFKKKSTVARKGFALDPGVSIFAALVIVLIGGVVFRQPVVRALPSLAGLYAAAGMDINVRGFQLADVTMTRDMADGGQILVVSGKISNVSGRDNAIPPLRIVLRSPTGAEIQVVKASAESKKLTKDGETSFKTVLANPPQDAKDVLVRFSGAAPSGS